MKKLLALKVVVLAVLCAPGFGVGQTVSSYDMGLTTLKEKIATQIERIKATRESADNQISVAKVRVEEQMVRSEEQLALQLESLEQLKEQLRTKSSEADLSIKRMTTDLSSFSGSALKDIEEQIVQTNLMLEKIRGIRGEICNGCSTSSATNTTTPVVPTTVVASNVPLVEPVTTTVPSVAPPTTTTAVPEPVATTTSGGG